MQGLPSFNNYIREQNVQTQINQDAAIMALENGQPMTEVAQQPQMQMQDNPFERYGGMKMPDMPITYGGGLAENLLNDNEVPDEVKKRFWFIFHKDNTLTFLDEQRQKQKMLSFDIMKIDILNAIPYYEYTFERELEFDVLRNVFETKLDRALGYKGSNLKNERIMLQSQFQEQHQISDTNNQSQIKEGFFKRLLGRR
jgi:hypothetical protein